MEEEKLINWSEVSRILTGNRTQVTSDYDGKLYKSQVNELKEFALKWLLKNRK